MVPTVLIFVPFLVSFVLLVWQYYKIDPRRRILNLRFGLMVGAIVACIGYPILVEQDPGDRTAAWVFFGLALFWLACSWRLLRRMPPDNKSRNNF